VIQQKGMEPRSVSALMAEESTDEVLHLRCTRAEYFRIEPFIETHYVRSEMPVDTGYYMGYGGVYGTYYGAYSIPMELRDVPVQEENVPAGEMAAHRGMHVEATDGRAGTVDQFLLDPASEKITHLVLTERHHLHKHQITVPVSAIDQVLDDTVYLKIDRHAVELLPAIPIKRHLWPHPADEKTELLAIVFEDTQGASRAFETVKKLHYGKLLRIIEAAVVVKEQNGTTSVKESMSSATTHGRVWGAVAGGAVGLLAGPVGLVVGALVGAGAGGAVADRTERDFSHEFLENLQRLLQPGRSALVLLVEHEGVQKLDEALGSLTGVVSCEKLSDLVVERIGDQDKQAGKPTEQSAE
jgi:uncharacterized membrane protein